MQFNNRQFGDATYPFKKSPFSQYNEQQGNPFPPGQCLLGIAVTSGVLALHVGGFLAVHCQSQVFHLINYLGSNYTNYQGYQYVEVQPE